MLMTLELFLVAFHQVTGAKLSGDSKEGPFRGETPARPTFPNQVATSQVEDDFPFICLLIMSTE